MMLYECQIHYFKVSVLKMRMMYMHYLFIQGGYFWSFHMWGLPSVSFTALQLCKILTYLWKLHSLYHGYLDLIQVCIMGQIYPFIWNWESLALDTCAKAKTPQRDVGFIFILQQISPGVLEDSPKCSLNHNKPLSVSKQRTTQIHWA